MLYSRIATVALATSLVAISGCGSSSKGLTRAEMVAKADAICKRSNAKRTSNGNEKPPHYEQLAGYEQSALNELRRLVPPSSMAQSWKQMIAADEILVRDTYTFATFFTSYNQQGLRATMDAAAPVQRRLEATAEHAGFADCSQFT